MVCAKDLITVYVSQGPLGAEVARSKLKAEGLQVLLRYEAVGRALGLTIDGLGRVQVCVRREDAALARAILETGSEPEEQSPADPA